MGQAIPPRAILIVEDEVFIRHDLMDFFSDRGFIAFEAEDGDEAIKIIADHPEIGIVLTDIQMKGSMDGSRLSPVTSVLHKLTCRNTLSSSPNLLTLDTCCQRLIGLVPDFRRRGVPGRTLLSRNTIV